MTFNHFDLKLIKPDFDSILTDLVIDLDYLRKKTLITSTHPRIFLQIKSLFHLLESIGSARIEGNRTTIAEYIETQIGNQEIAKNEEITEIQNVEKALLFIEENISNIEINRVFLSELHKIVVNNLSREGSKLPGEYRKENVSIKGAKHTPPDFLQVESYMDELFDFINRRDETKYDLLKIAIVHHRFAWIHPYDNGNGRTVRLITYAMLVKQGFHVEKGGRIVNPTAIFCCDREKYNEALAKADEGSDEGIYFWCEYVLSGLKNEIEKVDKLSDYKFLSKEILIPAIDFSLNREIITEVEASILRVAINKQVFKSDDIKNILKGQIPSARSRFLKQLREKKMIEPESPRKYIINFRNSYLLRGIIKMLDEKGFLPIKDETDEL
jgi:Fic family protein